MWARDSARTVPHVDWLPSLIDLFLHLDRHLEVLVASYGTWAYAVLFLIVFCETGLVVTPFLPGDSLLFAVGAVRRPPGARCRRRCSCPLLIVAADPGRHRELLDRATRSGRRSSAEKIRVHQEGAPRTRTQRFYEKYGGKTIILARFVPIVRTFAPFVAGHRQDELRAASSPTTSSARVLVGAAVHRRRATSSATCRS